MRGNFTTSILIPFDVAKMLLFLLAVSAGLHAYAARSCVPEAASLLRGPRPQLNERALDALLRDQPKVTVATLNAQKVYQAPRRKFEETFSLRHPDAFVLGELTGPREHWRMVRLSEAISQADPDVVLLQEVGMRSMVEDFVRTYLGDRYSVHIAEESLIDRGVAILLRKSLPFKTRIIPVDNPMQTSGHPLFVRTPMLLEVFLNDEIAPAGHVHLMTLVSLHAKSLRAGAGAQASFRRKQELLAIEQILDQYRTRYPTRHIIVGGDFNNNIDQDVHVDRFMRNLDLIETLKGRPGPKPRFRGTCVGWARGKSSEDLVWGCTQLDALLLDRGLKSALLDSDVHIYLDPETGTPIAFPVNDVQLNRSMPSDHLLLWADLDTRQILAPYLP